MRCMDIPLVQLRYETNVVYFAVLTVSFGVISAVKEILHFFRAPYALSL